MTQPILDDAALDQLFLKARTFGFPSDTWLDKPVSTEQLQRIWDLARMGPTAANTLPARIVWVVSDEAKARLIPLMDEGNRGKTQEAPATAIIGMDLAFYSCLSAAAYGCQSLVRGRARGGADHGGAAQQLAARRIT